MPGQVKCKGCGVLFEPTDRRQRFHDVPCRAEFNARKARERAGRTGPIQRRGPRKKYAKEKTCLRCGGELTGQRRRFCDDKCAEDYWNESRNKGRRAGFHFLTDIDEDARTATCAQCGSGASILSAGTKLTVDGRRRWKCRAGTYTEANLGARWEGDWRKRGIHLTAERYREMLVEQDYGCAICECPVGQDGRPHVDHDHATGKVRGLLCAACNLGLGKFGDDPERLEAAAAYIRARS